MSSTAGDEGQGPQIAASGYIAVFNVMQISKESLIVTFMVHEAFF